MTGKNNMLTPKIYNIQFRGTVLYYIFMELTPIIKITMNDYHYVNHMNIYQVCTNEKKSRFAMIQEQCFR